MTTDQHRQELEAKKKASAEANAKRLANYNAGLATTASNEAKAKFTPTAYQPPTDGLTLEEARKLSDNDLLTALKKQREVATKSYFLFHRDVTQLVVIYDATVERYSAQGASGAARNGKPTLREAFALIGWNYDAARTMKRRFALTHDPVPDHSPAPKLPQLTTGELVLVRDRDGVYVVAGSVDITSGKVPVVPQGDEKARPKNVDLDSLKKMTVPRKKIRVGDLIFCDDNGAEYEYVGLGKFTRTKTPTIAQQKTEADDKSLKARQDHQKAANAEKKNNNRRRKKEAKKRDLGKIAAKAKPNSKAKRWYKVGSDSRTLSIGTTNDRRASQKSPTAAATKPKVKVA